MRRFGAPRRRLREQLVIELHDDHDSVNDNEPVDNDNGCDDNDRRTCDFHKSAVCGVRAVSHCAKE